jgi:hypothetical protein
MNTEYQQTVEQVIRTLGSDAAFVQGRFLVLFSWPQVASPNPLFSPADMNSRLRRHSRLDSVASLSPNMVLEAEVRKTARDCRLYGLLRLLFFVLLEELCGEDVCLRHGRALLARNRNVRFESG